MVAAGVLWSTGAAVTRHVGEAGAFEQVFWRSLLAFVFVFGFLLVSRRNPLVEVLKAGAPGLLSGALWAVMFTSFVIALSLTSTANTLVVMSVSPLLTAFLARAVLKDPIPPRIWLAAAITGAGIAWMAASGVQARGARDIAGMLVALTVPMAAAINYVTLRVVSLRDAEARLDLVPAVMLGGLLSCLVAFPLALPLQASGRDLALLSFLGFFQLGLPCMLMVVASRTLPAPELALLSLLEVVLGVLWTWLFAGEQPAAATLAGGALVVGALAANELAGWLRQPASAGTTRP